MVLKLKRTPGLYLVGFMGSGKTTVGRVLAGEIGWPFCDLDSEIENRQGESITRIFIERGEAAFRELETQALSEHIARIEAGHPCVLALGGGAFVQPRNWELIADNGISIWLDCNLERVRQRLGNDTTRPLANRLGELFEERRPLYSRADFRVEVDCDDAAEIVRKILHLPIF